MEISHLSCRLCLSVTDFNVSLFGHYSRKTNMIDKILVCLKLVIEEPDNLHTICYKCAESVERFYDFIAFVKKNQTKLSNDEMYNQNSFIELPASVNRRHVTSYVREEVFDADCTFSFLGRPHNDNNKETKASSPLFSYFSPPNVVSKLSAEPSMWEKRRPRDEMPKPEWKSKKNNKQSRMERPRQRSKDIFESQSQDAEEAETRCLDWKLTPDKSIIRRVREKCFGPSDF